MPSRVSSVLLCGALAAAPGAARAAPPPAPTGAVAPIDRVRVLVDGVPVWQSAWDDKVAMLPASLDATARATLTAAALDELVDAVLVARMAAELHVEVSPEQVDGAVQDISRDNHLDAAGLEAALAQQGMTLATYRVELRARLLDLMTFQAWAALQSDVPSDPAARERAHEAWLGSLRRAARIVKLP